MMSAASAEPATRGNGKRIGAAILEDCGRPSRPDCSRYWHKHPASPRLLLAAPSMPRPEFADDEDRTEPARCRPSRRKERPRPRSGLAGEREIPHDRPEGRVETQSPRLGTVVDPDKIADQRALDAEDRILVQIGAVRGEDVGDDRVEARGADDEMQ